MLVYVIPMPRKTDHDIPRKDIMVRIIIVYYAQKGIVPDGQQKNEAVTTS
jgi:hypothetical protein